MEEIIERHRQVIALLDAAPVVVGHSFGGLVAQKLLGEGWPLLTSRSIRHRCAVS